MNTTSMIPFTGHEISALLAFAGVDAEPTRAVLELPSAEESTDVDVLGLSTLVVRDLATLDAGTVSPVGPAHHVAVAFATAESWLRVAVLGDDVATMYVVVVGSSAAVALHVRELGIMDVAAMRTDVDLVQLAIDVLRERVDAGPDRQVCSVRVDRAGRPGSTVSIETSPGGVWRISDLQIGDQEDFGIRDIEVEVVWRDLQRLLAAETP